MALFPELVRWGSVPDRVAYIETGWDRKIKAVRACQAEHWRKARALVRSWPAEYRHRMLQAWERSHAPATGTSFLSWVRMIERMTA